MGITETFILILLALIIISAVTIIEGRRYYKKKIKGIEIANRDFLLTKPPLSYNKLKEIIDTVIADVIIDINLRFEVNDVKYIRNVPEETVRATAEVMDLLSDNIIEQMKCYVSERFIIQYISRNVRAYLLDYLKQKNL